MPDPLQEDHGLIRVHAAATDMRAFWRPTPNHDVGIDGQIEFLDLSTNASTGKIVAVQVKSGPSFFQHVDGDDFRYYPSAKHVQYWRAITIPVILVLHDPDSDLTIYADVKNELESDGPIRVSKDQILDGASRDAILAICHRKTDSKQSDTAELAEHERGYEEQPEIADPELKKVEAKLDSFGDTWFETTEGQEAFDAYNTMLEKKQSEQFSQTFLPTLPPAIRDRRAELVDGNAALLKACRDCDSWDERSEYKLSSWLEYVPEAMLPYTSLPNLVMIQKSLLQYLKVHQGMNDGADAG